MSLNCESSCGTYCGERGLYGYSITSSGCKCDCGYCREGNQLPNKKPIRKRKMRFGGMNPVPQRNIVVNPSRGSFFSVPQDERNFGQQSALPYDQQLNFNHRNASGYSNFNQECTQDSHCDFDSICSGHGGFYGGGCVDNNCVAECMDRVAILENCPKPKRQIIKRIRR